MSYIFLRIFGRIDCINPLIFCLAENDNKEFPGIAFQQANFYNEIHKGKPFDICFSIEENNFRGTKTLQLNIKDIKIRE